MHCADCHFSQDEHGNGQLYAEYGNNIEIECQDCHGNTDAYTNLRTSGPAAPAGGTDLRLGTTPFGQRRFIWVNGKLFQRSMLNPGMQWEVIQVKDTITPGNAHYNERSAYAKTIQRDGTTWGASSSAELRARRREDDLLRLPHLVDDVVLRLPSAAGAEREDRGASLRRRRDAKLRLVQPAGHPHRRLHARRQRHDEGTSPRAGALVVSALVISSTNALRDRIYIQQPPISSPGYSSQAFNAHVPHTVRSRETQGCGSCHVTKENDNNAWLAQLLLQGTNFVNFIGRYAYVAEGKGGFEAVVRDGVGRAAGGDRLVAAQDRLSRLLREASAEARWSCRPRTSTTATTRSLQLRGEYLYSANGEEGFERLRRRQHRQQGFLRAHRHRSRSRRSASARS